MMNDIWGPPKLFRGIWIDRIERIVRTFSGLIRYAWRKFDEIIQKGFAA